MAETTPYFEGITDRRSVSQYGSDEQGALEGNNLISAEVQDDFGPEAGIYDYVNGHFGDFLGHLRALAPMDQEKLLAYYSLWKTQTQLSPVFRTTQTVCSFQITAAVRCMAAVIGWQGRNPTVDEMEPVLAKAGFGRIDGQSLAEVVDEYASCRSFVEVARKRGLHRPLIRRTISHASKAMVEETRPPNQQALGWWLYKLIDKANPLGRGLRKHVLAKEGDVRVVLPDICGMNSIRTGDPDFDALFQSRANF